MQQPSRDELREKLILTTIDRLDASGVNGVRARDLASEVGCAVGTIYNLVGDLDNLILLACARTLEEFEVFATSHFNEQEAKGATNLELLESMAASYVDFAFLHHKRWQAAFEVSYEENSHFQQTYVSGQRQLLGLIVKTLLKINPDIDQRELANIGRALWASVHGIATLAMGNPKKVLTREKVLQQCNRVIHPVAQSVANRAKAEA
ncbi:MAG: TetR-like C-terminal domain-containing protein [Hyphomicrobiales bacterium]